MIGNGILAFGVFFIVCLFLYLGFRFQDKSDKPKTYADTYTIRLADSMEGDSVSVYVNDSLLMNRTIREAVTLQINRFDEENALMVVNNRTDDVTSLSLNTKSSVVNVEKKNGSYLMEETVIEQQ